jgi:hypothetical protein
MGQAKTRGSREERISQARASAEKAIELPVSRSISAPKTIIEHMALQKKASRLFANMTTPSEVSSLVLQFTRLLSDKTPIFLDCAPEPWSRQSCCDSNVAKYIEEHGGRTLCGYRIWYNEPIYIEGERHAIWTDGEVVRDVSFVDSGETKVLFVPDDKVFDGAPAKIRYAFNESDKITVAQFEAAEQLMSIRTMSPTEAWDQMPTYESWLAGKRMPNLTPIPAR